MISVLATMLLAQVPSPPAPAPVASSSTVAPATSSAPRYFNARGAAAFLDGGKAKDGVSLFTVDCTGTDCSLTMVTVNRCRRTSLGDDRMEAQWPRAVVNRTRDGSLVVEALRPELGRFTMVGGNDRIVVEYVMDPIKREARSMTVTMHDKSGVSRFEPVKPQLLPAACPFEVPGTSG
jgi:hypothetical protein